MKKFLLSICLVITIFLSGCASLTEQDLRAVGKGVYATSDSIEKGRIDLADKYTKEVQKIIPAPKVSDRIKINQAIDNGKSYIIVPEYLKGFNIMVVDSAEYNALLEHNKALAKLLEKERNESKKFQNEVDDLKRKLFEAAIRPELKTSWWKKILWWAGGMLGIGGVITLLVMFPAAIPIVMNIVKIVGNIILTIVGAIVKWIKWIVERIQKWENKK